MELNIKDNNKQKNSHNQTNEVQMLSSNISFTSSPVKNIAEKVYEKYRKQSLEKFHENKEFWVKQDNKRKKFIILKKVPERKIRKRRNKQNPCGQGN